MAFSNSYKCAIVLYLLSFTFALDHPGGDTVNTYLHSVNSTLENLLAKFSTLEQQHSVLQQEMTKCSTLQQQYSALKQEVAPVGPLQQNYTMLQQQYSVLQQEVASLKANQRSSSIAFSVSLSSNTQLGNGQAIRFDRIYTNIGNGYNKYSGHFTAPKDGIYSFFVNINSGNSQRLHVQVVKNGAEIARAYSLNSSDVGSGSAAVHLQAGDIVWARHMEGVSSEAIAGGSYSSFSGFLIS